MLPLTDYIYYGAVAYCVAHGLWTARKLPLALRNAVDARSRGYFAGRLLRVALFVAGSGAMVLLGVDWVRWLLVLALAEVAWCDGRQAAVGFAEGFRGRVTPRAVDYVAGFIITSPTALLPALALSLFPPAA